MVRVFVDRDGTITHNNRSKENGPYYVLKEDQLEWMPGAKEAIVRLQKAGAIVYVITSQNCISKGLVTLEGVNRIHYSMNQDIVAAGGEKVEVAVVYNVKESDQAKAEVKASAIRAFCAQAAERKEFTTSCWAVGDTEGDIVAGKLTGCKTIHVELAYTSEKDKYIDVADFHVKSFEQAVEIILSSGG